MVEQLVDSGFIYHGLADRGRFFDVDQVSACKGQERGVPPAHAAGPLFRDDLCDVERTLCFLVPKMPKV